MMLNIHLNVYNGATIQVLGMIKAWKAYEKQTSEMQIFVFRNGSPSILGRAFMQQFGKDIENINAIKIKDAFLNFRQVINKFRKIFPMGLEKYLKQVLFRSNQKTKVFIKSFLYFTFDYGTKKV